MGRVIKPANVVIAKRQTVFFNPVVMASLSCQCSDSVSTEQVNLKIWVLVSNISTPASSVPSKKLKQCDFLILESSHLLNTYVVNNGVAYNCQINSASRLFHLRIAVNSSAIFHKFTKARTVRLPTTWKRRCNCTLRQYIYHRINSIDYCPNIQSHL